MTKKNQLITHNVFAAATRSTRSQSRPPSPLPPPVNRGRPQQRQQQLNLPTTTGGVSNNSNRRRSRRSSSPLTEEEWVFGIFQLKFSGDHCSVITMISDVSVITKNTFSLLRLVI
jgi:hypothetical protein